MYLSPNEIMKLEPNYKTNKLEWDILDKMIGCVDSGIFEYENKRICNIDYMQNCCGDNRERSVNIIFFDDIPIVFYQLIRRYNIENFGILNLEKYKELQSLLFKELYIDKQKLEETLIYNRIEINDYDADMCYIEDNKLISKKYS